MQSFTKTKLNKGQLSCDLCDKIPGEFVYELNETNLNDNGTFKLLSNLTENENNMVKICQHFSKIRF